MHRRTLTGPNGVCFILIAALLAVAPVPVGGNRPFFWELNAVAVGLMAVIYLGFMASEPARLRLPMRDFYWPALLGAISAVWMIIQILPLPIELFGPNVWSDAAAALDVGLARRVSVDTAATTLMLLNYVTYGLLFFLVAQVTVNDVRAHRFMQTLFVIITAHAGIGIFLLFQLGDTMLFMQKWSYRGFATGFFVNRNSFATFLAFGLGIGSSLLVNAVLPRQRGKQNRPFREVFRLDKALISIAGYGAGLAIMGSALLLTASRMGAFVGAIGLLMPVALAAARSPGRRRRGFAIALVLVLVVFLVTLLSGGGLAERFDSHEAAQDLRWPLFAQTIGMIAHRPFTGFGGGTFEDAFAIFHRLPLSADVVWDRAHNLYLELFADLGIFALGVMAAVGYVVWRTARALFGTTPSVAPVAAVTVATIGIVHSLVDFSLQIQSIVLMFIAVLAAGYAQAVGSDTGERSSEPEKEVARPRPARGTEAGPFAAAPRPGRPVAGRLKEARNGV